ncbi:MAG: hypothetical protein AAF985_00400 [Bacteroidota bacterium]
MIKALPERLSMTEVTKTVLPSNGDQNATATVPAIALESVQERNATETTATETTATETTAQTTTETEVIKKTDLQRLHGIGPITEKELNEKQINTFQDIVNCDSLTLLELFGSKKCEDIIQKIKKLKKEALSYLKQSKIGISVLAHHARETREINLVNNAINTLASFNSNVLPQLNSTIAVFEEINADNENLNFWIQDDFLSLQRVKDPTTGASVIQPVDDSLGRIEHISFSYYSKNNWHTRNSYNKIYTDLILKMARVFDKMSDPKIGSEKEIHLLESRLKLFNYSPPLALAGASEAISQPTSDWTASLSKIHQMEITRELNTDLVFKGGNVLFVGDAALVGYDTLIETYLKSHLQQIKWIRKPNSSEEVNDKRQKQLSKLFKGYEEKFKTDFSKIVGLAEEKIHLIGSIDTLLEATTLDKDFLRINNEEFTWLGPLNGLFSGQAIYHIDLFISAAGRDEISNNYRLVVGDPIHPGDQYLPAFNFTKQALDQIAEELVGLGFSVYRIPLPLTYIDRRVIDQQGNIVPRKYRRKWFFASYNNALVQYTSEPQERFVWMPAYGSDFSNEYLKRTNGSSPTGNIADVQECGDWSYLKKYDDESQALWESLGFKVERLTNYIPFAELRGAVRCFSKVLSRSKF